MAIIRAAQNGNWSATSSWIGGVVPTSTDDAVANNFNITMDVSTTVIQLRNDNVLGGTTGGQFQFSNAGVSVTITGATPFTSQTTTATPLTLVNNTTGTVTITISSSITVGSSTANLISHTGAGAFTFTFPSIANGSGGFRVVPIFTRTGTGTLTLNGNVSSGGGPYSNQTMINSGTGTINVIGNITGGQSGNAYQGIVNSNATVNVIGNVIGGAAGGGAANYALNSSGPVNITGSVTSPSTPIAMVCSSTVTINGTVTSNGGGTTMVCSSTVTINGTVTSNGSEATIVSTAANSITVTGNVIIGTGTGVAISSTNGDASVTLIGNFTNRAGKQAIYCQTIFLSDAVTNQLTYNTPGGSSRTLYSDDTFPNLPATTNVRFGTTYGPGLGNTGALVVPTPATVLLGVPTDNTTGTLLMTPADFVYELGNSTAAIAIRLQNCATVATTGDQVASYGA